MGTELSLDILPWALNCRWIFYHGHLIDVGYFTIGTELSLDILQQQFSAHGKTSNDNSVSMVKYPTTIQ
jgi:hypothetical protein